MDFLKAFTITKEQGSQSKVEGEIPFGELKKHRTSALKRLGESIEMPGFRKGNIPEQMIVARVGEMAILTEMAERTLSILYPHILREHAINAIGYPKISITKIAPENPLGFSFTVATIPDVKLPNYKKIAQEANKTRESEEVSPEEVEKQIRDILRQKLAYERLQSKAGETHTHADGTVHDGPAHDQNGKHSHEEAKAVSDEELPELTDEYVKTLGAKDQFLSVADFKAKIKEHLEKQKQQDVKAKHRGLITDAILKETVIDLPQVLIDSELEQMFAQMNDDLARAQLKMDDYLAHIKKTKEELKKEWTPSAEKRARLQLVLSEIAKEEKILPEEKQLTEQVDQLMKQYKDADETRVRVYIASIMQNEAVMQMLEQS